MTATTTMTIRVSSDLKERLGRLAKETRRSRSFLAAEAVASYVESELEIIEGIHRGLADVAAGRVVPHEQAMAEVEKVLRAARDGK